MRKSALILAACLLACAAVAEPDAMVLTVAYGSNTWQTIGATNQFRGVIDAIVIDVDTASGATGNCRVVWSPTPSTIADVILANQTNRAADAWFRPSIDRTSTAGSDLTGDPPSPYTVVGDIIFTVTNSTLTNVVYNAVIYFEK